MSGLALSAALAAIDEVRRFVGISNQEVEVVRQLLDLKPPLKAPASVWLRDVVEFRNKKKYDYVCAVVLIYGALERFIEDSVEEQITALCGATKSYAELPERLRVAHFNHFVTHLQRTRDARYDGNATAERLAAAFAGCLEGKVPYELIAESLRHHTANFRPAVVDEYYGRVAVDAASRRAVATDAFSKYLQSLGTVAPVERPEAVLDLIVELVSRRNEVSHGDITNTLAPSELMPYCDQVEAYCRGLAEVLEAHLLAHLVGFYGVDHGYPIAVFNHKIVCVQSRGELISVGSVLAVQRTDGSWYAATVVNVQVDGNDVLTTPKDEDVKVGLEIDRRCKRDYRVRTGVYEHRQLALMEPMPVVTSVVAPSAPIPSLKELAAMRAARDEAHFWLLKNGAGSQGAWLEAEYRRCCDELAAAEQASFGASLDPEEGEA